MDFSFIDDPRWTEIDDNTRQAMLGAAFQRDVTQDPRWNSLTPDVQKNMQDVYFQKAGEYSQSTIPKPGNLATIGKGLAHGTFGLAETIGTGLEYAGNRLGSEGMAEAGNVTKKYWGKKAEEYKPSADIYGKNVWDNPELLANGEYWLYNVADMVPALAASIVPALGVTKAMQAVPALIKLAKLGGAVAGGVTGGTLEGSQTYNAVLQKGGTEEEAARSAELMTLGAGVLNALSVGKVLSKAGTTFKGKVLKHLGAGAWEGITEGLEEPTEVFSKYLGSYLAGEELPTDLKEQLISSAKSALTVAPVAGITGLGGSVVSGGEGGEENKIVDLTEESPDKKTEFENKLREKIDQKVAEIQDPDKKAMAEEVIAKASREKELAEYNAFVESLTPEQKKAGKLAITPEPEDPKRQEARIRKLLERLGNPVKEESKIDAEQEAEKMSTAGEGGSRVAPSRGETTPADSAITPGRREDEEGVPKEGTVKVSQEELFQNVDERNNWTMPGDTVRKVLKNYTDDEIVDVLKWSKQQSPHVQRNLGSEAAAELRSRGVPVDEINWQTENLKVDTEDDQTPDAELEASLKNNTTKVPSGPGSWREAFNKEKDAFKKSDILRATADVSKSMDELSDIEQAAKGMPNEANILHAAKMKRESLQPQQKSRVPKSAEIPQKEPATLEAKKPLVTSADTFAKTLKEKYGKHFLAKATDEEQNKYIDMQSDSSTELLEQYEARHGNGLPVLTKINSNSGLLQGALIHKSTKKPGRWQLTYWDERGFSGDTNYETKARALNEAYKEGYKTPDPDKFKEVSASDGFFEGNRKVEEFHKQNDALMRGNTTKTKKPASHKKGDEVSVNGADSILSNIKQVDGIDYELWKVKDPKDNRGHVRVFDADSGEVVSNTMYPDFGKAEAAFNKAVEIVSKPAEATQANEGQVEPKPKTGKEKLKAAAEKAKAAKKAKVKAAKAEKNENDKIAEATKLHRASYGLRPKNSLQRLLSAKQILDEIGYPKKDELYTENERLIANYKEQLGIETKSETKKAKAPKKRRASKGPQTIRGAIKAMGYINFVNLKGELKDMTTAVKLITRKNGVPYDLVEKSLKAEGWMYEDENLIEKLYEGKEFLKRRHLKVDTLERKQHLTEAEKQFMEDINREPEAPPEGEYVTMNAEDLPEGKKLTIIDGNSTDGWDTYEVIEKDPFGITLKDGTTIELSPLDKVDVLYDDIKGVSGISDKQMTLFKPTKGQLNMFGEDITEEAPKKKKKKRAKKEESRAPREAQIDLFTGKAKEIQRDLFKPFPKKAPLLTKAPKTSRVKALSPGTVMHTTGAIRGNSTVVKNAAEVASLLAHIRKAAQENLFVVTTDKNGKILEIQKYSKGVKNAAHVHPVELAGHVLNIPEADTAYVAHNHPTGDTKPSEEDYAIMSILGNIMALRGIKIKPFIIAGTEWREFSGKAYEKGVSAKLKPILRNVELPVKERGLHPKRFIGPEVNNGEKLKATIKNRYGNKEGFIFFGNRLNVVDFLPFPAGESTNEIATQFVKFAENANATGWALNINKPMASTPARMMLVKALAKNFKDSVKLLDIIEEGKSYNDSGWLPAIARTGGPFSALYSKGPVYSIKNPQTKTKAFKKWFKGSKVVDENGEPLVVYHGTNAEGLGVFDISKTGKVQTSDWGDGIYFTPIKWMAEGYKEDAVIHADAKEKRLWAEFETAAKKLETTPMNMSIDLGFMSEKYKQLNEYNDRWQKHRTAVRNENKGKVYAAYLSLQNPKIYKYSGITDPFLAKRAKEQGHDGLIIVRDDGSFDEIIAFNSNQIKSATGNKGTFDPQNPDIRYTVNPGEPLTGMTQDYLKKIFHWADDIKALKDGGLLITKGTRQVKVERVKHIAINEGAFEIAYRRKATAADAAAGAYQNGTMTFSDIADKGTVAHESWHYIKDSGLASKMDVWALHKAIGGKNITEEQEAAWIEQNVMDREMKGRLGKLLQKVRDFVDSIVNLFHRTARGVVRDIESGKAFTDKQNNPVFEFAQSASYSLSQAVDRVMKNPNFQKWFKVSKAVGEDGKPIILFHATTHDITSFSKDKANIENDFGAGFYFTNTAEDANANYAGEGPDLTSRIEQLSERLYQEIEEDPESFDIDINEIDNIDVEKLAKKLAREQLSGGQPNVIPAFLSIQNPVYIGGPKETYFDYNFERNQDSLEEFFDDAWESVKEDNELEESDMVNYEDEIREKAEELYDENSYEMEETGTLVEFIENIRHVAYNYEETDVNQLITDIIEGAYYQGLSASELVKIAKESEGLQYAQDYDNDVGLAASEIIRAAFEASGFDGIIDSEVDKKFGSQKKIGKPMEGMNADTVHYIVFEPTQIKSIYNRGTFDATNPDIRYQISTGTDIDRESLSRQSSFLKLPVNSGSADPKFLSDIVKSPTFRSEGFRGLDIPTKRKVMDSVRTATLNAEIRDAVIELIPVDVVNNFTRGKWSPNMLLHNQSMLSDLLSVDGESAVPVGSDIADSLIIKTASLTTKLSTLPSGKRDLKDISALLAGDIDSLPGPFPGTTIRAEKNGGFFELVSVPGNGFPAVGASDSVLYSSIASAIGHNISPLDVKKFIENIDSISKQGIKSKKDMHILFALPYLPITPEMKSKALREGMPAYSAKGKPEGAPDSVDEPVFKTGSPVTFDYIHNKEKSSYMGSRFGQDKEPAGQYIQTKPRTFKNIGNWETGTVTFQNPIVIDWGGGYGEDTNWKNVLSKKYGGKTGKKLSAALIADGHDGVVTIGKHGKSSEIVNLTPNPQSALGKGAPKYSVKQKEQAYDGSMPETMIDRARETLTRPFNDFMYWIVDKNRPIATVQKHLKKVTDGIDVFLKETQRPKITAARIQKAWDEEIKPLIAKMAEYKINVQDLELYKHALHAREANKALRRANAKMQVEKITRVLDDKEKTKAIKKQTAEAKTPEDWYTALNDIIAEYGHEEKLEGVLKSWKEFSNAPSGMSDAEAVETLKRYKGDAKIEELGKMLDSINDNKLLTLFNSGMLSEEEYSAIAGKYKHYVPLYREGFDDSMFGPSRGLRPGGRQVKVRGGSTRKVINILGHSIANYEKAINTAEKARSQRALLGLIDANPESDIISVSEVKKSPRHDQNGNLRMYPDLFNVSDNEMRLMVNGKQYLVSVQRDNKDAMLMLKTLKAEDGMSGPIVNTLAKLNRFLAKINTTWSPEFIISNFVRDIQTAGINIQDTGVKGKGMLKGAKDAWGAIFAVERGKPKGTELESYYERFKAAGGKIGWADVHGSVENLSKKITAEIEMQSGQRPIQKRVTDWVNLIEDMNTSIENGIRLHVFKLAVEQGKTDERAAQIASDLTVDFTKKGAAGPVINSLYLFANAGIQGSYRIMRAATKSRAVQKTLVGIIGAGFMAGLLNSIAGGEDDDGEDYYNKIDDFIRERNMIFMLPGTKGKFVKIPLPWGYNLFWNIGAEASRAFTKQKYSPISGAGRLISVFANAFNPVASGTLLQTLSPTVSDPFVQVAENKNWFGGDLMPTLNKFDKTPTPDSQRYWKSASVGAKWVTFMLNSITGGDKIKPGVIDVSPETLDLIVDTFGGSALRFVQDSFGVPAKVIRGEEIQMYKVPFLRRVAGEVPEWANSRVFYNNINGILIAKERLKAYRGAPGYINLLAATKKERRLIPFVDMSEKKLRGLRKMLKAAKAHSNDKRVKQIENQMNNVYINFNKKYNEIM